ncbi:hypothetical protein T492DRAFT_843113 [Pavlovales sp. CCMP2436]|nr:hypothetical protein T492DRAFT_843113 [Pavlovales sp. CCMP2436]
MTEGAETAPDAAPHGAMELIALPDALLASMLVLAGPEAIAAACRTCTALAQLSSSDVLWSLLYAERYAQLAHLTPSDWGIRSYRALCAALRRVEPLPGLYFSLSEFPWGQLVAVRLETCRASSHFGQLVAETLQISVVEVDEDRSAHPNLQPSVPAGRRAVARAAGNLFSHPLSAAFADTTEPAPAAASDGGASGSGRNAQGFSTEAATVAVGLRTRAGGGRTGWLCHSHSHLAAERAVVSTLLPPCLLDLMKPWLNGAQLTHRFFGEEFWPVAHAGRLHRGELLLLLLEAPLPLPDPPPASSVENSEESDAESEAGEADSEAHSAQVGNEADSEAGAAASAVASAPASEQQAPAAP